MGGAWPWMIPSAVEFRDLFAVEGQLITGPAAFIPASGARACTGRRPTVPISAFMTLVLRCTSRRSSQWRQSDAKLAVCLVPKHRQALFSFIDPLKELEAELTLPSLGFEPRTCVEWKRDTLPLSHWLIS
ncbi:hypothetical protein TNCV_2326771 [Trichonephila clavipes]|nr:hypothetical protein TNCV_2326771 [Trichonephila clavipes]